MNENIELTKILKDCPKGWKFYSSVYGNIEFIKLLDLNKILFAYKDGSQYYDLSIQSSGKLYNNGECIIFPSKYQRDWSKFVATWYKKEKFDPKTLKPYDRVLVSDDGFEWFCSIFSHIKEGIYPYMTISSCYAYCIPYNDNTKHLVCTTKEPPEYYRYWKE